LTCNINKEYRVSRFLTQVSLKAGPETQVLGLVIYYRVIGKGWQSGTEKRGS
jgi:hypothetical protein